MNQSFNNDHEVARTDCRKPCGSGKTQKSSFGKRTLFAVSAAVLALLTGSVVPGPSVACARKVLEEVYTTPKHPHLEAARDGNGDPENEETVLNINSNSEHATHHPNL